MAVASRPMTLAQSASTASVEVRSTMRASGGPVAACRGVAAGDIGPLKGTGSSPEEALERVDDLPRGVTGPVRVLLARPAFSCKRLNLGPDGPESHDIGIAGLDRLGALG